MRTEVFELGSPQPYYIRVATPQYGVPPDAGWPLVTILGHDAFDAACAMMRYHMDCRPPAYLDAGVLVGVGYVAENRRQFDYTPSGEYGTGPAQTIYGGAEAFLHFLLERLRPALCTRLPLHPKRQALAGHSLGGLFTLHTLLTHPAAFQTYIASSPSVWWGDRYLERKTAKPLDIPACAQAPIAVQISVGEYEQTLSPLEQTRAHAQRLAQVRAQRRMVDGNRRVAQTLASNSCLQVGFHVYPEQYHRSVWPNALNLGLLTALRKR